MPVASTRAARSTVEAISVVAGSTAVSFRVRRTSSSVCTSPAMEMGPASKRDSLATVVAVATSSPSSQVAVASQVTSAGWSLTVTNPSMVNS